MSSRLQFRIAADHPALPGHFPGTPVVPGVLMLEQVAQLADVKLSGVRTAKFLHPLLPEQLCEVEIERADGRLRFKVLHGELLIAEGQIAIA